MLSVGLSCLILLPNEQNKRLLIPGKVLELQGDDAIVELEEPLGLEVGCETSAFAEWRGKFFQQGITIAPMIVAEGAAPASPNIVRFTRVGEAVSAESRGSYRVSVATCELFAHVGDQTRCHVVDISPEGCAVICSQPLTVGQTVEVGFSFDGMTVGGEMKVQTVKELRNGKLRFGLFAHDKKSTSRKALQNLSIIMQRLQLKRLAGAA